MYLGIDLGTSSVKAVVTDAGGHILDEAESPLTVSRPAPLWSEQDPRDWWKATDAAVRRLNARGSTSGVQALGLSGQMHGAVLLGQDDRPLRPAILWNDGRSAAACRELETRAPDSRRITGNRAMPGFTAPKLIWAAEHEPEVFAKTRRVLLPKDALRLQLTGEAVSDVSDASGTLWLDVGRRSWSEPMLAACRLPLSAMPRLVEGPEESGRLRAEVAAAWGLDPIAVAGGAGDQAAGAIGAGVVRPGEASLSLGTSGVLFVADDKFRPFPERAVHAFCHALPGRWHQMSVILSAASCLTWVTRLTGAADEAALLAEIADPGAPSQRLLFLPYLSGERTPHDDPDATGVFIGLDHDTDRGALARAVLEGVAFALADGLQALLDSGSVLEEISVIGGGSKSDLWGRILASVLRRPLHYRASASLGPALGAARLARMLHTGEPAEEVCTAPPLERVVEPEPSWTEPYAESLNRFRTLYARLSPVGDAAEVHA